MPPPPPADLPLMERLSRLANTLQFAWFFGHLTLLFAITRYSLSFVARNTAGTWGQISYRTTFVAAAATYGIVVYKTWRARQKSQTKTPAGVAGVLMYLGDENIQYLGMALVWLFMPQYSLALLPYGIYSVFHVATYTRANLIPTLAPQQKLPPAAGASPGARPQYAQHPLAESIGAFVKRYYDASMSIVAQLELVLWVYVLVCAIFFVRRSWILLALYTAFVRARYAQSSHIQYMVANYEARINNQLGAQGTPPVARQIWDGIKGAASQFVAVTDINKYVNGAAAPKKTS